MKLIKHVHVDSSIFAKIFTTRKCKCNLSIGIGCPLLACQVAD